MTRQAILALAFSLTALTALGQSKSGKKSKKANNPYTEYKTCRSKALRQNATKNKRSGLKKALASCRNRTPQAVTFENCKKKAIKVHKNNLDLARQEISKCREIMMASTFDRSKRVPVERIDGRVFFAGVDLSKEWRLKDFKNIEKSYNCELIRATLNGEHQPEFLLFGNRINAFRPTLTWDAKRIKTAMSGYRRVKKPEPHKNIPELARVYISSKTPLDNAIYFAMSYCSLTKGSGRFYEALKVYFLLNYDKKTATPFMGVSFYSRSKKNKDQNEIVKALREELGESFREFATQRDAIYLVEDEIREFDAEGDPFDICQRQRKHKVIAILKGNTQKNTTRPRLLVVANIDNLCKFGDERLAAWTKKLKKPAKAKDTKRPKKK